MPEAPEGVIIGGWPFVIAAYTITTIGLAAAIARLASWQRKIDKRAKGA
ncbi:MAG: hypothetical protein GY769_21750 [bacterium]|nr:hypothetical protein [bacterium]